MGQVVTLRKFGKPHPSLHFDCAQAALLAWVTGKNCRFVGQLPGWPPTSDYHLSSSLVSERICRGPRGLHPACVWQRAPNTVKRNDKLGRATPKEETVLQVSVQLERGGGLMMVNDAIVQSDRAAIASSSQLGLASSPFVGTDSTPL
jgi:hypothetical protein